MQVDEAGPQIRAVLALHPEVRLGILFGSVAEGKARADSDVDLAVSGPSSIVLALARELSIELGCEVDVVRLETAPIPLLDELLRAGIVVYEARAGDGAAWRSRTLAMLETDRPWYQRMRNAFLARLANASGR
jgi:predicted nucleotidyltransferase